MIKNKIYLEYKWQEFKHPRRIAPSARALVANVI